MVYVMALANPHSWMWAEACEMLERAQRLQRQFFRFGQAAQAQPRWEPPIDIVAYGSEVQVTVAIPGAMPEHVQVRVDDHGRLNVAAVRPLPLNPRVSSVHRLEIPYGRFERRIELPAGRYRLIEQACFNGCLVLRLTQS
ncbi:MAG TPA: Hsp20/alpha crystallin family protein [Steroidobacter sp.]|jgi:HSP20 family molecular chaperone IbpA|nr:Hsp20/alpha crystallin family protein [Steroidobacter sp.]